MRSEGLSFISGGGCLRSSLLLLFATIPKNCRNRLQWGTIWPYLWRLLQRLSLLEVWKDVNFRIICVAGVALFVTSWLVGECRRSLRVTRCSTLDAWCCGVFAHWQCCIQRWQGANAANVVAGVRLCDISWKLTEASHETSILNDFEGIKSWDLWENSQANLTLDTEPSTLYTPHITLLHSRLQTLHCKLPTSHFTLHGLQSEPYTLYTLHFTLPVLYSTVPTRHPTRYTSHFTLHTAQSTLHNSHFTLRTPRSTLRTLHSTHTLHSRLLTVRSTLHMRTSALHTWDHLHRDCLIWGECDSYRHYACKPSRGSA